MEKRVTYWIDGEGTTVQREDDKVWIQAHRDDGEDNLEIFLGPELFPAILAAIEAAGRRPASPRPRLWPPDADARP